MEAVTHFLYTYPEIWMVGTAALAFVAIGVWDIVEALRFEAGK